MRGPFRLALVATLSGALAGTADPAGPTLEEIVELLGGVAETYVGRALDFSCVELVHWRTYDGGGRSVERQGQHRSNYLFSGSGAASLEEVRAPKYMRRMEDVEAHKRRSAVPVYVERAYFWILLFHPDRRERYRYTLEERLQHEGRPAARVRFEPVPPIERNVNEWYGTALVDLESLQLLHAEGVIAESHDRLTRLDALVRSPEPLPVEPEERTVVVTRVATEFGVERNGTRFPSEVRVDKTLHRVRGEPGARRVRTVPIHEVRQVYKDYRFYHVAATPHGSDTSSSAESSPPVHDAASSSDSPAPEKRAWVERFDLPPDDPDYVFDLEEHGFLLGTERPESWEGRVADGSYRLSNLWETGAIHVQTISIGRGGPDVALSARVRVLQALDPRLPGAGLLCRYDPQHHEYYALLLNADGHVQFQRRTRSGFVVLFSLDLERLEPRFYEIELRAAGSTFQLALDGQPLGVVQDGELSEGLAGIIAVAPGGFAFDDLTVAPR